MRGRAPKVKKKRQGRKHFEWAYIMRSTRFWPFEPRLLFAPIIRPTLSSVPDQILPWVSQWKWIKFHTRTMVLLFTCFLPVGCHQETTLLFKCETTLLSAFTTPLWTESQNSLLAFSRLFWRRRSVAQSCVFGQSTGQTDWNCTVRSRDPERFEVSSKPPV